MATLEQLDQALADAKTALKAAKVADGYARAAWQNALDYLGLNSAPSRPVRSHGSPKPAPTPVLTTDLPGLANTLISTNAALKTAQANVTAAQVAFTAAQLSAQVQT